MADRTKIEWTATVNPDGSVSPGATWNPITGCSVVSPGCTNCYAMRLAGTRMQHHWSRKRLTRDSKAGPVWNGTVRLNEQWLDQPLRWRKPRRIFVAAHGDLFHEAVPDEWIDRVFAVMALAPQHSFLVLTKRAERMRDYIGKLAGDWMVRLPDATPAVVSEAAHEPRRMTWPLPNVWLGCSVEDQQRADERIPHLLATPAALHWISAEPLLGPITVERWMHDSDCLIATDHHLCTCSEPREAHIGWVVAGGESGPNARPAHPDWFRSLRDQCAAAGVAFHFKQWGRFAGGTFIGSRKGPAPAHEFADGVRVFDVGKRAAGRLLDGRVWDEFPERQPA